VYIILLFTCSADIKINSCTFHLHPKNMISNLGFKLQMSLTFIHSPYIGRNYTSRANRIEFNATLGYP